MAEVLQNFLIWISIKATNTSDKAAAARIEIAPKPKGDKKHTRRYNWSWTLPAGQTDQKVARYTFFPINDPTAYDHEDAARWLQRTVEYWRGVMQRAAHIEVPCRKATDALLAAHVCQLIANDHGDLRGGEGFYDVFYIRDGAYQMMELEEAGFMDTAAKAIKLYLPRQRDDGRFESQKHELDANGQAVWTLWQYCKITGDRAFLERVYPKMLRAVQWTMQARRKAPADSPYAGVLPAAQADGEYLWDGKHHIVGYDLWNLRGVLCTANAARMLGKEKDVEMLLAEAKAYRAAIDAVWKRTGLAHLPPSWENHGTHWGNTETLWPTELFARDDPRVAALSRHVRKEYAGGFVEGTIRWVGHDRKNEAIHPYMGAYTTMSDLARGRDEKVVEDFYWYLLHTTAAHAFPEGIHYEKRFAWLDTIPHVTGACNYAIMLRHMLVHESGNELHLLSAVPDWWLGDGKEIRIERLSTHFGEMSMTVRGTAEGIKVDLKRPTRNPPKRIALTVPKSRPLVSVPEGVQVIERADQRRRWDFPTVVKQYRGDERPIESR